MSDPDGTVTVDGTDTALGTPADRWTSHPLFGALAFNEMVRAGKPPPLIEFGVTLKPVIPSPVTDNEADLDAKPSWALIVLINEVAMAFSEITKAALIAPAGTVTVDGNPIRLGFPADRFTTQPPLGAAPPRKTVPEDVPPAVTVDGFSVRDDSAYPLVTIKVALWLVLPSVAVIRLV